MTKDTKDTGFPPRRAGSTRTGRSEELHEEGSAVLARKGGRADKKSMTVYIDPETFTKAKIAALVLNVTLEQFVEKALIDATVKVEIPRLD